MLVPGDSALGTGEIGAETMPRSGRTICGFALTQSSGLLFARTLTQLPWRTSHVLPTL
jgi:hypothetical protein